MAKLIFTSRYIRDTPSESGWRSCASNSDFLRGELQTDGKGFRRYKSLFLQNSAAVNFIDTIYRRRHFFKKLVF